jgi:hypothetical protein
LAQDPHRHLNNSLYLHQLVEVPAAQYFPPSRRPLPTSHHFAISDAFNELHGCVTLGLTEGLEDVLTLVWSSGFLFSFFSLLGGGRRMRYLAWDGE